MKKFTIFKYIDPDTNKHYMTIKEEWDEIYDGEWKEEEDEKIIIVKLREKDNFL